MRRRTNESGLTLIELMVVVTIVAVLLAATVHALTRDSNSGAARLLSFRTLVALRQARNLALDTGAVTEVGITADGRSVLLYRSSLVGPGLAPPTAGAVWIQISKEEANGAQVRAIRTGAEPGVVASPASGGLPTSAWQVRFNPDGSATAMSIYISDISQKYQHKVIVYGISGHSKHLTRW